MPRSPLLAQTLQELHDLAHSAASTGAARARAQPLWRLADDDARRPPAARVNSRRRRAREPRPAAARGQSRALSLPTRARGRMRWRAPSATRHATRRANGGRANGGRAPPASAATRGFRATHYGTPPRAARRAACLLDSARQRTRNRASEGPFRGAAVRPRRFTQRRRRQAWWTPRSRRGCLVRRFAARVPCVAARATCQSAAEVQERTFLPPAACMRGMAPSKRGAVSRFIVHEGLSIASRRAHLPRRHGVEIYSTRRPISPAEGAGWMQEALCGGQRGEQAAVRLLGFIRGRGTRGGGSGRKRRGGI